VTLSVSTRQNPLRPEWLIARSVRALRRLRRGGEEIRLQHLTEPLGASAPVLVAVLVSCPFLLPFSLGPLSAPAAMLVIIAGLEVLADRPVEEMGRVARWFHAARVRALQVPVPAVAQKMFIGFLGRTALFVRRFCRPRMPLLASGPSGRLVCGGGLILGALLLAIPTPGVPLMNTLPALGIMLLGIGRVGRDGWLVSLGYIMYLAGALLILGLLLMAIFAAQKGIEALPS
jgi:hypothetical protein